jgi:hypothetical protein
MKLFIIIFIFSWLVYSYNSNLNLCRELKSAIDDKNINRLRQLLKNKNYEDDFLNKYHETPLTAIVKTGDVILTFSTLHLCRDQLKKENKNNETPLLCAIKHPPNIAYTMLELFFQLEPRNDLLSSLKENPLKLFNTYSEQYKQKTLFDIESELEKREKEIRPLRDREKRYNGLITECSTLQKTLKNLNDLKNLNMNEKTNMEDISSIFGNHSLENIDKKIEELEKNIWEIESKISILEMRIECFKIYFEEKLQTIENLTELKDSLSKVEQIRAMLTEPITSSSTDLKEYPK